MAETETAGNYRYFLPIGTRWMDNDVYGHINNVTYYSYFDTVANHYLITEGGLDIHAAPVIALVVESTCSYHAPLAYPDQLRAGLRVDRLSTRSVTYGIAIFNGIDDTPPRTDTSSTSSSTGSPGRPFRSRNPFALPCRRSSGADRTSGAFVPRSSIIDDGRGRDVSAEAIQPGLRAAV